MKNKSSGLSDTTFRLIVETAEEGIWIGDSTGKTLFVNQKMAQMLGYTREEMMAKERLEFKEIGQGPLYTRSGKGFQPCSSIQHEYKFLRKDGGTIWTLVHASPLFDGSGQYIGNLLVHTDITQRKQLEASLIDAKDEMEARVEERTKQLTGVSRELQHGKKQLQKLVKLQESFTQKLLNVQEEERKRISRELHDETAQYLAILALALDAITERKDQLTPDMLSRLIDLRQTASEALQEVRRFSHELRPGVLEQFGLAAALELIINEFNDREKTKVKLNIIGSENRLSNQTELALFRITQEALTNIRKHAQANDVEVTLKFTDHKIYLNIQDDGVGFNVSKKTTSSSQGGLGLMGMKERAQLVGAKLQIKSKPDRGTVVSVEVPSMKE